MAPPRNDWQGLQRFDPLPQAMAGALTTRCVCGWEAVFIQPEEHIVMVQRLFMHLINDHHLALPEIRMEWH